MRFRYLVGVVLGLWGLSSVDAQPVAGPDSVHVVRAVGYASIYGEDSGRARDEAIADARVRALESLGFYLEGEASLSRGRLLDRTIQARTRGVITAERVLQEGPRTDVQSMYEVEIEVWVKLALSPEERHRLRRKFSVVLDIPQEVRHDGDPGSRPMDRRSVENALRDALIREGFEVYNREQLSHIRQIDTILGRIRERDSDAVQVVTDYAMAEIVITGKVDVEFSSKGSEIDMWGMGKGRIYFYYAYPNVFAMEGESGREIASYSNDDGIKGGQLTPRKAAGDAANKAREPVVQTILEGLRRYAGSDRIAVTVVVSGLPDVSKYRVYQRLLKGLRWVEDVEADDFRMGGVSSYRVRYKERFFFLLSQMYRLPGLDRMEGGNLRITSAYTGLP